MYPRTQAFIQKMITDKIIPGAAYTFMKDGETSEFLTGNASLVPEIEPLQAGMLYDLASITKVMLTGTIILQLWQEGQLALDDLVQKYLPDLKNDEVTILDLLTHSSDINGFIENRDGLTKAELIQAILDLPTGERTGKVVKYTDTGFILLGWVVEAVTGMGLEEAFEARTRQPLGLVDTVRYPVAKENCVPTQLHPQRGLIRGEVHDPKALVLGWRCGSAGLFSSMKDMEIYAEMFLNRGKVNGKPFFTEKTIQALLQDWTYNGKEGRTLGWVHLATEKYGTKFPAIMHTGYTGTLLLMDIEKKEAFIFLSNRVHPEDHNKEFLVYRDQLIQTYLSEKG